MAGRPRTKQRLEAAERAAAEATARAEAAEASARRAATPGAVPSGVRPLGTRARTHEGPTPGTTPQPNAARYRATGAWTDKAETEQLTRFAEQLAPSMTVRIYRRRPLWCTGWLEDIELEEGTLGELLAYLKNEHGGERYLAEILTVDGRVGFRAVLPVAGAPRRAGRVVSRDEWEGTASSPRQAAPVQAAPAGVAPDAGFAISLLDKVIAAQERQTESFTKSLQAVVASTQETLAQSAKRAAQAAPTSDLGSTIRQLAEAKESLDQLGDAFRDDGQPTIVTPPPSPMTEILKVAVANEMGKKQAPPPSGRLRMVQPAQQASSPPPQQPRGPVRTIKRG